MTDEQHDADARYVRDLAEGDWSPLPTFTEGMLIAGIVTVVGLTILASSMWAGVWFVGWTDWLK